MPFQPTSSRLFGLDLAGPAAELRAAWQGLVEAPWLEALAPAAPVRLLRPDGQEAWVAGPEGPVRAGKPAARLRALAVELPEASLLRRRWTLPAMPAEAAREAAALDLEARSPFEPGSTLQAFSLSPAGDGRWTVEAALSARPLVDAALAGRVAGLPGRRPEEAEPWIARPAPLAGWWVLPSPAGVRRERARRRRQRAVLGLWGLALLGGLAAALGPSWQLRTRALQAQQAFQALQRQAEPALAERAAVQHLGERVEALAALQRGRADPLEVLAELTAALPDDTHLTAWALEGRKVRIEGLTDNAARLMRLIDLHPRFEDVRAPLAAVRPPGQSQESFTLEFSVEVPAAASAPAPAASAPTAAASSP